MGAIHLKDRVSMSKQPSDPSQTQIDLGDDLIGTQTLSRPIPEELAPPPEATNELLLNAKILIGEGLLGEAKQVLRKILLKDSSHVLALEKIAEIQKLEIKQLLNPEENKNRRNYNRRSSHREEDLDFDGDQVRKNLERDLGIEEGSTYEKIKIQIADQFLNASAQDRMDIGVAFLEMELFDEALAHFELAKQDISFERKATALSIYGKIISGKAFEALLDLDPLIADEGIESSQRVEYGYLMARALEELGKHAEAHAWYRGVLEIESQYRDSFERLKKCEKALSSSSRSS
jgi:tetratricopeptide (TPR) repeat protein